jgi:phosphoenolpyruvate-protein kinase (PTS system EI component)
MGRGELVNGAGVTGVLRRADTLEQVFALMKREDLDETILLCESASASAVAPVLPRIKGLVCESGGATSHLAIIGREFNLTCLMSTRFDTDEDLDGATVEIGPEGTVEIVAA